MKRFKIQCKRTNGENGSINLSAILEEMKRMVDILKKYSRLDRWNADKVFPFYQKILECTIYISNFEGTNRYKTRLSCLACCDSDVTGNVYWKISGTTAVKAKL